MHFVKEGFLNEFLIELETGNTEPKESLWWFGRASGLLEAGVLTQDEHDEISNKMAEMFAARKNFDRKNPKTPCIHEWIIELLSPFADGDWAAKDELLCDLQVTIHEIVAECRKQMNRR